MDYLKKEEHESVILRERETKEEITSMKTQNKKIKPFP